LEATDAVEAKPRVTGQIERVNLSDGEMVEKGACLFTIDPQTISGRGGTRQGSIGRGNFRAIKCSAGV
jgi:multidrug efflux pump subunit AcrA (membrane-fusion protein)